VVEDINEHPFRVERMLLQLLHCGILARQKALVLGSFTSADPNEYDAGYNLNTMVEYLRSRLDPGDNGACIWSRARDRHAASGAHAVLEHDERSRLTISGHPVLGA
jgi:muramoyltetrapeptide carboxypeptidase